MSQDRQIDLATALGEEVPDVGSGSRYARVARLTHIPCRLEGRIRVRSYTIYWWKRRSFLRWVEPDAESRRRTRLGTKGPRTVVLGTAVLCLLVLVGVSYHQWWRYRDANAEAGQTRDVLGACDQLLSSLTDAETSQRGFLLTGEQNYLQPYNHAIQEIPAELSTIWRLLGARAGQSGNAARLNALTADKLAELRETIDARRMGGLAAALAMVENGRGQKAMDDIRGLCEQIRRIEISTQSQASADGEAAAGTALLLTIAGSLVLLFLFAFGMEPFASPEPQAWQRPWPIRYGAAVLAVIAIALLRAALIPLIGRTTLPFTLFFFAVAFAAWFGGFRPAVLSIALSLPVGAYFFAEPTGSLLVSGRDDQVAMLMIVVVGYGVALLSRAQRTAVDRAGRAENAERNERRRFETTLASIGDAVIATDGQGRVSFANPVALSLLGRTEAEVTGKPLPDVFHIVDEFTRAPAENPVGRVLREGAIVGLGNHTKLIAKDGHEIPIDDSAAPILDDAGQAAGVVLVFRDISERKRADQAIENTLHQLRAANAALARANEGLNQFAFAASHDLQEPLRMITSYSQLLLKSYHGQLDGQAATCVEYITQGTQRMHTLLADLLAYTQISGEGEEVFQAVDLNDVLRTALENCKTDIVEAKATVTSDPLPWVLGHSAHYIQLFQNLIGNSIKYRSERPALVHVSAERENGQWRISVKDNGVGIAPEYHKQIFGVFKRLHGRDIPGTGIGLAICQRVVERYGGHIWVQSDVDQGATFYFTLPGAEKRTAQRAGSQGGGVANGIEAAG